MIEHYIATPLHGKGPKGHIVVRDGRVLECTVRSAIGKKIASYRTVHFTVARRCIQCHEWLEIFGFVRDGKGYKHICKQCFRRKK